MRKWVLLKNGRRRIKPEITIEESAKEDFKKLMDWDENKFFMNTIEIDDNGDRIG